MITAPEPRTVCAWCGVVICEGPEPTSHGICQPCATQLEAEAADFAHDNKP